MTAKHFLCSCALAALTVTRLYANSDLALRIPDVNDAGDPIEVFLDLTSDRDDVASVGARLTYDDTQVSLTTVEVGADAPGSWSFVFLDTSVPGQVDFVLTDQTAAAATVDSPSSSEMLKLMFSRVGGGCSASSFGFNASAPDPGPPSAAFPENHYVIYVDAAINIEAAAISGANGPATEDHRFLRGNVNNRSAHVLDIQDVVDLVATLFTLFDPGFECDGAFDVNNDGNQNIADVVALAQGVFGSTGFVIPEPRTTPQLTAPDGGSVPSASGCNEGESCL